jgi:hypothetical protein
LVSRALKWRIEGKDEQEKLEEFQRPLSHMVALVSGRCLIQDPNNSSNYHARSEIAEPLQPEPPWQQKSNILDA